MTQEGSTRRRAAEAAGWAAALALALVAVAVVASTSAWLLYRDGDSIVVALMADSLRRGDPQDWALSPVLFLPETAVFAALSFLGLGTPATLTLNAVVNLLAVYGSIRLVAGRRRAGVHPVAGAVLAFAAFVGLILLEEPAETPGFHLALLTATTTYYSATVVGTLVTVGLVRRLLDGAPPRRVFAGIAAVAAVSTLTNPLFVVWCVLPVVGVIGILLLGRHLVLRRALPIAGSVLIGAAVGYLLRVPFAGNIVAADGNYLRPDQADAALAHLTGALSGTVGRWDGVVWGAAVLVLLVACGVLGMQAWRRRDAAVAAVCAVAVAAPVAATLLVVVAGTDADRYLQPWVFLPVLVLAVAPPAVSLPRAAEVALAGVLAVGGLVAVPVTVAAAGQDDADLACVTRWVEESGRTGAGQFWTVRAPKLALADPAQLVQVDHTLRPYDWLVNRAERRGPVTFLVESAADAPYELPVSPRDAERVACGRYTILDFGSRVLPLGEPRN
ncbi:hypothetical protein ACIGEP_12190 [Microbacterium sp. NPDC077663]|uniref:hypothetical protein n=1 Tax=Microbacterium sp. NPDC077663 TaxID=3364189 RepID=UPI0037C5450D